VTTPYATRTTGPTAAIAGIAPGVQSQGLWAGRRQLFVRFAGEAETATLFTAEMLTRHMERAVNQSPLHSISLCGRDPLASTSFLADAFGRWMPTLPIMADVDGQRPESIQELAGRLALVQVTVDLMEPDAAQARAVETLRAASQAGTRHAAVIAPRDGVSDAQILRFVEQAHQASPGTKIVVHPVVGTERPPLDRRYATLVEKAMAIHPDVRLVMRVLPPVGTR
jgi:hypothetical protein